MKKINGLAVLVILVLAVMTWAYLGSCSAWNNGVCRECNGKYGSEQISWVGHTQYHVYTCNSCEGQIYLPFDPRP